MNIDAAHPHDARTPHLGSTPSKVTAIMIAVLTTLSAIGPFATDAYTPAFPEVMRALSSTPSVLQLTLTAFFVGAAAGQLASGPLSDRLGRRLPLIVGIILTLTGSIGCAIAFEPTTLLLARFVQGFGGGFGMVLGRAVLIDLARGPELFRTLNIMQGISGVAPIIAPLIGSLILMWGTWREVFWMIASISLISLIGVLAFIPETLPRHHRHSGGFRAFSTHAIALLRRRRFTAYVLTNAFSAFVLMAYVSASSFVLQTQLGYGPSGYALMFAINATGMMSMSFLSARLTSTVHPRRLIRVGLTISALAVALLLTGSLVFSTPAWLVFPGFFLLVSAQGLIFGNGGALASREALHMAGTASAILGLGFSFAASVSAPLVGLCGPTSSLPMAFTMVGGVVCAITAFIVAGRGEPSDDDREFAGT